MQFQLRCEEERSAVSPNCQCRSRVSTKSLLCVPVRVLLESSFRITGFRQRTDDLAFSPIERRNQEKIRESRRHLLQYQFIDNPPIQSSRQRSKHRIQQSPSRRPLSRQSPPDSTRPRWFALSTESYPISSIPASKQERKLDLGRYIEWSAVARCSSGFGQALDGVVQAKVQSRAVLGP